MEEQFVPYQQALKLKELGFDEECCFGAYHNENNLDLWSGDYDYSYAVKAPLWQQAFDWFRKEHQINLEVTYLPNIEKWGIIVSDMKVKPKDLTKNKNFIRGVHITNNFKRFDTYEEARQACLEKSIEICQQKK